MEGLKAVGSGAARAAASARAFALVLYDGARVGRDALHAAQMGIRLMGEQRISGPVFNPPKQGPISASSNSPSIRADSFSVMGHHLLSLRVSSSGRSFSAIASRARKILDRTVPIGQFMIVAMSS
jgi:hypothetical protein